MTHENLLKAADATVALMQAEGYTLDYSIESLDIIDTRIEHFREEGETSDSMSATMTAFGAYVGEVIRRRLGRGDWVKDEEGHRLDLGSFLANPIGKCMERLDNGREDSVKAFAEVILLVAAMPDIDPADVKAYVESQMKNVRLEVVKGRRKPAR